MAADVERDMFLCIKDGRLDMSMRPSLLKAAEEMGKAAATFATATPAPVAAPVPPPKAISVLTDDEQKQVKARLAPFWVDILPTKGGMTADDGLTTWNKLIKFANSFYPDANDYKKWTLDKWEPFLEFLDEFNEKNGAVALVAHINGKINAA
jgi:putative intracellular protease/amidase